jgi:hypothetical protein
MPRRHLPIPLMPNRGLLVATILLLSLLVYAETLRCQVTYGGKPGNWKRIR